MEKTYTTSRKYALPGFTNFDITSLTPTEDPVEQLLKSDELADNYYKELKKQEAQENSEPSKTYRVGNDWFVLNKKEDKLYKKEPSDKKPLIKGIDVKDNVVPF